MSWLILSTLVLVGFAGLFGLQAVFSSRLGKKLLGRRRWVGQLVLLSLTALFVIALTLTLPIDPGSREQLLSLLGVVLAGAVALSSTTFLGNALAGLMVRALAHFRPGDFLRVGEHFGRVSERGLLHTEIQTEDGDLTTLPNLFVITNPVTVVREQGSVVSARLSLGYDLHHTVVERLLLAAAEQADLQDAFVQVTLLGDFSVSYRVAGFLSDVSMLVSRKSRLRKAILDVLHGAGIEIVSPTFMNQRRLEPEQKFVARGGPAVAESAEGAAEAVMFDKAAAAAVADDQAEDHAGESQDA